MNIPGFTAEASVYGTRVHYQSTTTQNYTRGHAVIAQMRIGGGGILGFWECFGCVLICSVFFGVEECWDACKSAGACDESILV